MMRCEPEFIVSQPKGHFAAFIRGQTDTAVSLRIEFGVLEKMSRMNDEEEDAVREDMRSKYAVHFSKLQQIERPPEPPPPADIDPSAKWG